MKSVIILLIFIIVALAHAAFGQDQNASQRIYTAINAQREQMKLPPLVYRIGEQLDVEERANEISFEFALSDDCNCDYESIAGDNSLQQLVTKLTNTRKYEWLHFEEDARFAAIAVIKREGIFYCVVRTYVN